MKHFTQISDWPIFPEEEFTSQGNFFLINVKISNKDNHIIAHLKMLFISQTNNILKGYLSNIHLAVKIACKLAKLSA